jgi:hypothetical protein
MSDRVYLEIQLVNSSGIVVRDWARMTDVSNNSQIITSQMMALKKSQSTNTLNARIRAVDTSGRIIDILY